MSHIETCLRYFSKVSRARHAGISSRCPTACEFWFPSARKEKSIGVRDITHPSAFTTRHRRCFSHPQSKCSRSRRTKKIHRVVARHFTHRSRPRNMSTLTSAALVCLVVLGKFGCCQRAHAHTARVLFSLQSNDRRSSLLHVHELQRSVQPDVHWLPVSERYESRFLYGECSFDLCSASSRASGWCFSLENMGGR